MAIEVRVPTLGESVTEATVATWFKKPGEQVTVDETLAELETDKVSVEVPAPASGTIAELVAKEGETVGVDALLATIEEGAGASSGSAAPAEPKAEADAETGSAAGNGAMPAGEPVEIRVPTLGESVTEATIATWFKQPGEAVTADEVVAELETDKVSVEVTAPVAGRLGGHEAQQGATVGLDALLTTVIPGAGEPAAAASSGGGESAPAGSGGSGADIEHAPSAKRAMAEKGLTPDQVKGTGRDGRIMKEDVARTEAPRTPSAPSSPAPAPAAPAPRREPIAVEDAPREKRVKMTRLRQTIARRLKDAQNTAAMLTTYNEVDMTGIMDLRNEFKEPFQKKHGIKLGFMSFFVKACVHALQEVPAVNAEIDGTDLVYKNYYHVGVAVGTPTGLVVPVVRNADQLSFAGIEKTISELGVRARDGKLAMADMQGGTFTISNGGVYGSLMSSPILNPPQAGILGMHKIQERPMVIGGQIVARPMMYLALSYDHRIIDGKEAVTFLVRVKDSLEDPRRLLMDL
ncbi:2-oxoglutarate dehydrogenase complex dihydrolipoyllysine-residue succinyltransferase [Paralimibaculum aggregatum]|uniref:Dihydrolipoyllysine-residue succinyltransferase component of 2-oxoglutarate dehydrogenase complex n=1 Tax=Paralimibaculum aggregatum TaxID=3036245 RepID=A0ABQ6LLW3_9RHOB|nr:2-oxoglutarate dehydrogenase complex dihydrolipoyllysine-residue succinyltransferase [Limibaculum sp. NKW23]GMG83304.1 2-oxoglutarate dehydrogenase complex dihydrolipoyllysine-residue succinyltransferase [Limibaculum sp. NKW23]